MDKHEWVNTHLHTITDSIFGNMNVYKFVGCMYACKQSDVVRLYIIMILTTCIAANVVFFCFFFLLESCSV